MVQHLVMPNQQFVFIIINFFIIMRQPFLFHYCSPIGILFGFPIIALVGSNFPLNMSFSAPKMDIQLLDICDLIASLLTEVLP